jgi:hypothetical protein
MFCRLLEYIFIIQLVKPIELNFSFVPNATAGQKKRVVKATRSIPLINPHVTFWVLMRSRSLQLH